MMVTFTVSLISGGFGIALNFISLSRVMTYLKHSLSCFFCIELFRVDFPFNIASKSLTDKPSPLKKVGNGRSKSSISHDGRGCSSSDFADADVHSYSGYYRSVFNFGINLAVVHRPIKCEKIAQL